MRIDRKKLVIAMMDRDYNINQLAELAGMSRVTVSSVKCGKSCSPDTVKRISKALGIKPEQIIE